MSSPGSINHTMYLRFGDVPDDEKSKVWKGETMIDEEQGVSVYDAKIDENGNISLCLPLPLKKDTFDTLRMLIEYSDRKCYLVEGNPVGIGRDGEPLIRNVKIIREIKIR